MGPSLCYLMAGCCNSLQGMHFIQEGKHFNEFDEYNREDD